MRLAVALAAGLAAFAAAGPAGAHTESPETVVADLGSPQAAEQSGIARVERDARQPRLLVVRVGEGWWKLPTEVRRDRARGWADRWRHAVPQGIIAVLDARTDRPVVRFGARGEVVGVAPVPSR